jgi:tetratricopeptide (TPR) repeat protein
LLDRIHQAVNAGNDALAINLILERYEEYRHAIELYEQMYEEMLKWPSSRALLCLSRLLISEYIARRKYAKAIAVTRRAFAISEHFVFACEPERELIEVIARKQGVALR